MNMRILLAAGCLAIAAAAATPADAYIITTPGIGTQILVPAADTLTLNAGSVTAGPGIFDLQPATYFVGDSGTLLGNFNYVFNENITIDGDTEIVPISVENDVSNFTLSNLDNLTIFTGAPVLFSGPDVYLTI